MRGMVPPDPQSHVTDIQYAVVYAPRRARNRVSAVSVEVMESLDAALAASDPAKYRYAAQVHGPSKSSEGLQLYYILTWYE